MERLQLYLSPDKPLSPAERDRFREIVKKRHHGVPVQQLTGEVMFFGLSFRVRPTALIPRPETEELVELALDVVPRDRPSTLLDLGTGSGVIAICLAKYAPLSRVMATDISPDALALAKENASRLNVADRIQFIESDWDASIDGTFDVIVSNPPYIDTEDLPTLQREVRDHEPRIALDGGESGFASIRNLAQGVRKHMMPGGKLLLEIGDAQGEAVVTLLGGIGLEIEQVRRDLAGKERFVIARCP